MERPKLSAKMSPLTVGRGTILHYDDIERMELHLDPREYTSLVTQRTRPNDMFTVISKYREDQRNAEHAHVSKKDVSHKGVQASLPKTYITKSGSLFLYSDSKVMKDNQEQFLKFSNAKEIEVQGQSVSPRREVYPTWGKLLSPRQTGSASPRFLKGNTSKRYNRQYIKGNSRTSLHIPYTTNYAITPVKLINVANEADLDTVKELSDAILAYREHVPTEQDKYMKMMKQTWRGRSSMGLQHGVGRQQDIFPGNKHSLSKWTHEWIEKQTTMLEDDNQPLSARSGRKDPTIVLLERARTTLNLTSRGMYARAPTNTPMSDTQFHGKLGMRSKSRVSSETPLHVVRSPSVLTKSSDN